MLPEDRSWLRRNAATRRGAHHKVLRLEYLEDRTLLSAATPLIDSLDHEALVRVLTEELNSTMHLQQVSDAPQAITNVGLVTSEADLAMNAVQARNDFGVDGTGIKIGVLSDSFNALGGAATDIASGDLPGPGNPNGYTTPIVVLDDLAGGGLIDEGRGMMQLIHDIAPGAELLFHTAFRSEADFAQGIVELANAGADIIIDDITYFAETMFQDDVIAQAVDQVTNAGVAYFASAGNYARDSYESSFRDSGTFINGIGDLHDFDPGPGVDILQRITVPSFTTVTLSFQWDQPSASAGGAGSNSNYNIYLVNLNGQVLASGTIDNLNGDAVEVFSFQNRSFTQTQYNLAISRVSGPDAGVLKYIHFGNMSISEFATNSSTVFGHSNANGTNSVGAAFFQETPAFGVSPAELEPFSSAGGTPILFSPSGQRLTQPEIRNNPDFVAPDGTNTTFFGSDTSADADTFPNFFGTSAAAPHAGAVAALMIEAAGGSGSLTPAEVGSVLESTAIDMDDPDLAGFQSGFDFATGFGLIDAQAAVASVSAADTTPPAIPSGLVAVGQDDQVSLDWNDNTEPDFDRYIVFRSTSANGTYTQLGTGVLTASQFTDTDVVNGTTYFYRLAAVDTNNNQSAQSAEVSATPQAAADTTPPAIPSGLVAVGQDDQVSLDWNDNTEPDFDRYIVFRSTSANGTYTQLGTGVLTASQFTDTDVVNGTTYFYRLAAVDTNNNQSAQSAEVSATPQAAATDLYYFSLKNGTTLDGLTVTDEDVVAYNPQNDSYSLFFDGSQYGLDAAEIDGLQVLEAENEILFSLVAPQAFNGFTADDSDIVRFDRSSETFSLYFDASDVGLTANREDTDAFSLVDNPSAPLGVQIVLSTRGNVNVPNASGADEDLLLFTPTSLGNATNGSWSLLFDGSDVELTANAEDIDALAITPLGNYLLSTTGNPSVTGVGVTERDDDMISFAPSSLGTTTSGIYQPGLFFDGPNSDDLGGFSLGSLPTSGGAGTNAGSANVFYRGSRVPSLQGIGDRFDSLGEVRLANPLPSTSEKPIPSLFLDNTRPRAAAQPSINVQNVLRALISLESPTLRVLEQLPFVSLSQGETANDSGLSQEMLVLDSPLLSKSGQALQVVLSSDSAKPMQPIGEGFAAWDSERA